MLKSRNKELVQLFDYGIRIHHVGILNGNRGLTERLFPDGLLKVTYIKPFFVVYIFTFDLYAITFSTDCLRPLFALVLGARMHIYFSMGTKFTSTRCFD